MSQREQFMYAETITAMKRAMARRDDASDSDDSIQRTTNRGNKLKRKAKFTQEGRLFQADGPRVYKRAVIYNGYHRQIIHRNPRRVDADGDSVDEDTESNPDLTDSEDDPYAESKLEHILMPLASAADLDKHPSLSQAYKSKALDEMIVNAQDTVRREQEALWHAKQLMVRFRGDHSFVPVGGLLTEQDVYTLQPLISSTTASIASREDLALATSGMEWDVGDVKTHGSVSDDPPMLENAVDGIAREERDGLDGENMAHDAYKGPDVSSIALEAGRERSNNKLSNGNSTHAASANGMNAQLVPSNASEMSAGRTQAGQPDHSIQVNDMAEEDGAVDDDTTMRDEAQGDEEEENEAPAHRMTTRAKAQAEVEGSSESRAGTPADFTPAIHPFFMSGLGSMPAAPPTNTELLRLMAAYVQKQEEVVRQSQTLLRGLQKAMRLRRTVWKWCRAEGHVGEMSDGEDWYDMEEWGLDEPLKKGNDEEDEELVSSKNTRNRGRGRAAAAG